MPRTLLLLLPVFALWSCPANKHRAVLSAGDQVQFLRANRGHEIVVKKGKHTARMRLVGVYAFDEAGRQHREIQALAERAARTWSDRFEGKTLTVALERSEPDPRGRFLGYLQDNDSDIAVELLKEGLLARYTEYPVPREAEYRAAEDSARQEKRGIWASETTVNRLKALRQTWSAAHQRRAGKTPQDSLLEAELAP